MIKCCAFYHLVLVNVYEEEPLYQYVPDRMATDMDSSNLTLPCDNLYDPDFNVSPLCQSMMLLCDGLASGALISQYEQLYRKNPDLSMAEAKKVQNVSKNRYRDIAPCKFKYIISYNVLYQVYRIHNNGITIIFSIYEM